MMPLSTGYTDREVRRLKESEARRILAKHIENPMPNIVTTAGNILDMTNWDARRQAAITVLNMTNREVYKAMKGIGYTFNNERATWLKD